MPDLEVAPLLCGGLIGYRALRLAGDGERLGLYGFGAAAHIICQVAAHQGRRVFAFTRADDDGRAGLALVAGRRVGRRRARRRPEPLDAAIIFAPAGELVPAALRALAPGGGVVCAGIHMSDIPSFPYERPVGGARRCARSPTSRAPTPRSSSRSRRRSRSARA